MKIKIINGPNLNLLECAIITSTGKTLSEIEIGYI